MRRRDRPVPVFPIPRRDRGLTNRVMTLVPAGSVPPAERRSLRGGRKSRRVRRNLWVAR